MSNFCECITSVLPEFPFIWAEVLFDEQQNKPELVSLDFWHAGSSRKEKEGEKGGQIYHLEMSDHHGKKQMLPFPQNTPARF